MIHAAFRKAYRRGTARLVNHCKGQCKKVSLSPLSGHSFNRLLPRRLSFEHCKDKPKDLSRKIIIYASADFLSPTTFSLGACNNIAPFQLRKR